MTLVCQLATKTFGTRRRPVRALDECSFAADRGQVVGIVGPNGAGKTTLLRLIAGETTLTSGSIEVAGFPAGSRGARWRVGYAPDPPTVPPELTGREWLAYMAAHRAPTRRSQAAAVRQAIELGELREFAARPVRSHSRGMIQRLALAAASLAGSAIVVLDEVLSGIDPLVQRRLRVRIRNLAASGRLVLIASHDLATVQRLATRVLLLWRGRLQADVETARLARERVVEVGLAGASPEATRVLGQFRGAAHSAQGMTVPLDSGLTPERVLAACAAGGVKVTGSRCRGRTVEDLLVAAAREMGSA